MRVTALLLVVCLGCTHRQSLGDGRALVGEDVEFSAVPLVFEEGEVTEVEGRVVVRGERGDFQLSELNTVREIRRARGAWEGLRVGFPAGVVLGAVYGYSRGDDTSGYFRLTAGENAIVAGVMFGILGGLAGLLIGAVRGSRYIYTVP